MEIVISLAGKAQRFADIISRDREPFVIMSHELRHVLIRAMWRS